MAQIHWTHNGNGNWATASDWSSGTVPSASDDVFIGIQGIAVTSDANVTVHSIGTNSHSRLVIDGNSEFVATNGTGPTENLGTIKVQDGSVFEVDAGTFYNNGTVLLDSVGNYTNFQVRNVVQLEGGGKILMMPDSSNPYMSNGILGDGSSQLAQIDNVRNDIQGSGFIGYVLFDNQTNGIIETNTAYGAGTLRLVSSDGPGQGFQNEGHVFADDGGTLELMADQNSPAFFNSGTFFMNSVGDRTVLQIWNDVKLDGGGHLTLSDNFYNYVETNGSAATFENVDNFISGSGQVYDANLTLMNDANGTIEADHADAPLLIYTGNNDVLNFGTMESVNGANLEILSAFDNVGTFEANGGNALVVGQFVGYGKTEIFSNSQVELMGILNYATVTFENNAGDTGVLMLDHATVGSGGPNFKGSVAGLQSDGTHSDTLGMQDINFASGVSWSFTENANGNRGVLTVNDGDGDIARITLLGHYLPGGASANSATSNLFHAAPDDITHTVGTLITTDFFG
jgi:hypothetical protein